MKTKAQPETSNFTIAFFSLALVLLLVIGGCKVKTVDKQAKADLSTLPALPDEGGSVAPPSGASAPPDLPDLHQQSAPPPPPSSSSDSGSGLFRKVS